MKHIIKEHLQLDGSFHRQADALDHTYFSGYGGKIIKKWAPTPKTQVQYLKETVDEALLRNKRGYANDRDVIVLEFGGHYWSERNHQMDTLNLEYGYKLVNAYLRKLRKNSTTSGLKVICLTAPSIFNDEDSGLNRYRISVIAYLVQKYFAGSCDGMLDIYAITDVYNNEVSEKVDAASPASTDLYQHSEGDRLVAKLLANVICGV